MRVPKRFVGCSRHIPLEMILKYLGVNITSKKGFNANVKFVCVCSRALDLSNPKNWSWKAESKSPFPFLHVRVVLPSVLMLGHAVSKHVLPLFGLMCESRIVVSALCNTVQSESGWWFKWEVAQWFVSYFNLKNWKNPSDICRVTRCCGAINQGWQR